MPASPCILLFEATGATAGYDFLQNGCLANAIFRWIEVAELGFARACAHQQTESHADSVQAHRHNPHINAKRRVYKILQIFGSVVSKTEVTWRT
jgi:hypothetical protein